MDSADPLNGWSWPDVKSARGAGSNDVYGKLYFHVFDIVSSVYKRLRSLKVKFQVHSVDAKDLPTHVTGVQFDRIEVSYCAVYSFRQTPNPKPRKLSRIREAHDYF